MPDAGHHEHDPEELVSSMRECIFKAVEELEKKGWSKESVKGIGWSITSLQPTVS